MRCLPSPVLGSYLQSRSYTTLYDCVAGKHMRFLGAAHPFLKKAVFLTMHLLFGSATMGIAVSLLWRYWWAHISFMVTLGVLSCWNASLHYRQTFLVERRDRSK